MPNSTKYTLQSFAKYAEIINTQLRDVYERLEVVEAALRKQPDLVHSYNQALEEKQKAFSPGPNAQLRAIRRAIENLPD